jgi:hypothetical protein
VFLFRSWSLFLSPKKDKNKLSIFLAPQAFWPDERKNRLCAWCLIFFPSAALSVKANVNEGKIETGGKMWDLTILWYV